MKRIVAAILIGSVVSGCARSSSSAEDRAPWPATGGQFPGKTDATSRSAEPTDSAVAAYVGGRAITMEQLHRPLVEAYGLNALLHLVQLELAKEMAEQTGVTVTSDDLADERRLTLAKMFKDASEEDHPALLQQFLGQQKLTPQEFDIVIATNAHLRKIAEPRLEGAITEEALQEMFRAQYGETVSVRHIQLSNLQEIAEAQRRLAAGEPFEQVAREMSRNDLTAPLGGEIQPPFSRTQPRLPQSFKDTAFVLDVGEVSDPVLANGSYHLIKLENRYEPVAVKFEDVKESLRADFEDRLTQNAIKELRNRMAQQALQVLRIEDPTLREQFEARKRQAEAQVRDRDEIKENLEKQREQTLREHESQPSPATDQAVPATAPESPTTDESADESALEAKPASEPDEAVTPSTTDETASPPAPTAAPAAQAAPATLPAQ